MAELGHTGINRGMPKEAILVTWSDMTGAPASLVMLRERLASYQVSQVLVALSQIAGLLKTWQNAPDHEADYSLALELLPSFVDKIKRFHTGKHIFFSRISLLYVAKQACVACRPDEGPVEPPFDLEPIFGCCLIAHDLITEHFPSASDTTIQKAAGLLPLANYIPRNTYPRDLARNLLIFEEIAPQFVGATNYRDLTKTFTHATGVPPRVFCELAYNASIKFITKIREQADSYVLTSRYLEHSNIPPKQITDFFARSSLGAEDLQALAQHKEVLGTDFIIFQRYPLIQINGANFICPDPGFLFDKFGRSLYWTLHEALPAGERLQLLAYWSTLIERYVQWLFASTYQGRGIIIPSPRFRNGDEAFDIVLSEGSRLVVFEVKASTSDHRSQIWLFSKHLERRTPQESHHG
jgi:hypothetical protein